MIRRAWNIFTGISLVLCLATVWLWLRSFFLYEGLFRNSWNPQTHVQHSIEMNTSLGWLATNYRILHADNYIPPPLLQQWNYSSTRSSMDFGWSWWSFDHRRMSMMTGPTSLGTDEYWTACFRLWPFAVLASLPFIWTISRTLRHRHLLARGICTICGYDLRATPDRCPECGTAMSQQHSQHDSTV